MVASWILQGLLAIAFLVAGSAKLLKTRDELLRQGAGMAWVGDFSGRSVRTIGALEVLGGAGLTVPSLVGILPILTPVAAGGLVLLMIGAARTHFRRREYPNLVPPVILAAMAAAVVALRL